MRVSELRRRSFLLGAACLLPSRGFAAEALHIGAAHGTIDFAIGDSRLFRTTGSFRDWQGTVIVDEADPGRSTVVVKVNTASIEMLDPQQTATLEFVAPRQVGDYPYVCTFPGHWRIMQGTMKVAR